MVAASEGNLESVIQLITLTAHLSIRDLRGNDALDDARREKRTTVINHINTVVSNSVIEVQCSNFSLGLLKKGLQQAIGSFHKKFSNLLIKVEQPLSTLKERMDNLKTGTFMQYFTTQELFLHRVIRKYESLMHSTYTES